MKIKVVFSKRKKVIEKVIEVKEKELTRKKIAQRFHVDVNRIRYERVV